MVSRKKGRTDATSRSSAKPRGATRPPGDEPALPGWPDPMPERMRWLENRIERVRFSRAEVVRYWQKAVAKARDARIAGLSVDTALEAAYSAGRQAAAAVLASRHIRSRGALGHHEATFAAVAALELPGCDDLLADSEGVRMARHEADYHAASASSGDLKSAVDWVNRTLPLLRAALVAGDPGLDAHLDSGP